ncbi:MAG: glycosyltransferase family 4 protein [Acidimicrobiales bacterium]
MIAGRGRPSVVMVADQLHQRVSGGVGVYTSAALVALAQLLPTVHDVSLRTFASAPRGGGPQIFPFLGLEHQQSRLPQPFAQRAWDRGLETPKQWDLLYSFSMGGPKPRRNADRCVYNVHDAIFLSHPEFFPPRGRRWHQKTLQFIRDQSGTVVTVSEASKSALAYFGIATERIVVIGPGADHLGPGDAIGARALLAQLGVQGDYILTASTVEPRKNLVRLFEAFSLFREEATDPVNLVVVGPHGWGDELAVPGGAVATGYVSSAILSALYAAARCFVYVPLIEGYGLPVLEAQSQCLPVVASPVPAADGSTIVVDPMDPGAIANGMRRAFYEDALRARLVTEGLLRTAEMTWLRTGERHLELFRRILLGGVSE